MVAGFRLQIMAAVKCCSTSETDLLSVGAAVLSGDGYWLNEVILSPLRTAAPTFC